MEEKGRKKLRDEIFIRKLFCLELQFKNVDDNE